MSSFCLFSGVNLKRLKFPVDKDSPDSLFKGVAHRSNHNTGYKGRTAIHEIIEVDLDMKQLIFNNSNQNDIVTLAKKKGMATLREAAIDKLIAGHTTIEEVIRATIEG